MKHTQYLQFSRQPAPAGLVRSDSPIAGRRRQSPLAAETATPTLPPSSLFVMEDELPSSVVVNHPDMARNGSSSSIRNGGGGGSRRNSGSTDNVPRVSFVRHPDIPEVREDEETTAGLAEPFPQQRRRPPSRRKVSIQLNNNSTAVYTSDSTEDLYLVAPEPLEPEFSVNGGGYRLGGGRRDRSLSLPAVHGNFRLLRSAQSVAR